MTGQLTIVGLGGSLARVSRSLAALRVALDGAAAAGATTTLLDLRELDLPMFNPDTYAEPPPAASRLIEACYDADGMLWSSPMYQGSISGAFKNALVVVIELFLKVFAVGEEVEQLEGGLLWVP